MLYSLTMSNGASPSQENVVKITPSTPGSFTYGNFSYVFSVADGELMCSCTHSVKEGNGRRPRLVIAQALEQFTDGIPENEQVTDTFKTKCSGILSIQLKHPTNFDLIFSARAFPRDASFDPWDKAALPARTPSNRFASKDANS